MQYVAMRYTITAELHRISIIRNFEYSPVDIGAADAGEGTLVEIAIELRASARSQFISYLSQQDGNNKDQ